MFSRMTSDHPTTRRARLMAALSLGIGWFTVSLAWLGANCARPLSSPLAVVLAGASALAWVRASTPLARAALLLFTLLLGVPADPLRGGAVVARCLTHSFLSPLHFMGLVALAVLCGPVARAMRPRAKRPTLDHLDDALLASSLWLTSATASGAWSIFVSGRLGIGFRSPVAQLLAPLLLATMGLAALSSLAAAARALRWLARWRAVARGAPWELVDARAWSGPVPEVAWMTAPGAALDGVLLLRRDVSGGAYRDGAPTTAVTRAPRDLAAVRRWLYARLAAALVIAAALAALVAGPVSSVRW